MLKGFIFKLMHHNLRSFLTVLHKALLRVTLHSRFRQNVNLPDSKLKLNELTRKDIRDLATIGKDVDINNLSFANDVHMVKALHKHIDRMNYRHLANMLKIETKERFKNLPQLLLAVTSHYPSGIMIAHGDLAVEYGFFYKIKLPF